MTDRPFVPDVLSASGDGADSPLWTRKRPEYEAPVELAARRAAGRGAPAGADPVPYAELHVHSNFSFLDGASHPEELAEQAARLGLRAVAITDHDGFYGVVRFAEAARALDVRTVFGAELSLPTSGDRAAPRTGAPDPSARHLLVPARGPQGYARLSRVMSEAHLRGGEKGRLMYDLAETAAALREHG